MNNVIIGFSERKKGEVIKDIIVKNGFVDTDLCTSGEEVLRIANQYAGGIVVCGYKVGSVISTEVYELLPEDFGMLVLLSRNQAELMDNPDIFSLVLPINKVDLIRTINMILEIGRKNSGGVNATALNEKATATKVLRTEDDKVIIEKAKLLLMNKFKITEDAAHRFIQKNSMNKGMKMIDTAKIILRDD